LAVILVWLQSFAVLLLQLAPAVGDRWGYLLPLLFPLVSGAIKGPQVIEFLRAFKAHIKRKLLLIWDGLSAHRSRLVRSYLEGLNGAIQIEPLPLRGW